MGHWVYVLRDDNDGSIYVGETIRLYRRWNEHQTGRGGVNTSNMDCNRLIGLYKVSYNKTFLDNRHLFFENTFYRNCEEWDIEVDKQDALEIEKHITERYIYENQSKPSICIRGGPYTTEDKFERFRNNCNNTFIDRPLCKCGYPCEVKIKNNKEKVYFVCPIPQWDEFYDGLELDEPCDFWEEFKEYRIARESYSEQMKKQSEWWVSKLPLKRKNDGCIKCNTEFYTSIYSRGNKYAVCHTCFHSKFEELKHEYEHKVSSIALSIFKDIHENM